MAGSFFQSDKIYTANKMPASDLLCQCSEDMDIEEKKKEDITYYGINIPEEDHSITGDRSIVTTEIDELRKFLKRNPHSRFLSTPSWDAAEQFAFAPPEISVVETPDVMLQERHPDGTKEEKRQTRRRDRASLPADPSKAATQTQRTLRSSLKRAEEKEKEPKFPSPRTQDLTTLAREITQGNNETVKKKITENPRLLCSDSDCPTALQEGCRYNALHIAAKANNSEMALFVLQTVSRAYFMKKLYPSDSAAVLRDRTKHLVNAYLNTPDKRAEETPLHFACKFNSLGCVEVLVSHPWCKQNLKNDQKLTPFEIIGTRGGKDAASQKIKQRIQNVFVNQFIVPIWRDLDNYTPSIGKVAHIHAMGKQTPSPILKNFPDFADFLLDPCDPSLLPKSNSENFLDSDPGFAIKAFAGPTSKQKAEELYSALKRSGVRSIAASRQSSPALLFNGNDSRTGELSLHSTCKEDSNFIALSPYSPIISALRTPSSPIFTSRKVFPSSPLPSPCLGDPTLRAKDPEKGLERIARKVASQNDIPWLEYWSFIQDFCNFSTPEGLQILENYLLTKEFSVWLSFRLGEDPIDSRRILRSDRRLLRPGFFNEHMGDGDTSFSMSPERAVDVFSWRQEREENSDDEEFRSANASPVMELEEFTDCADRVVFINGSEPAKEDFQVLNVIKDANEEINPVKFPMVFQWFNGMLCCGRRLPTRGRRQDYGGEKRRRSQSLIEFRQNKRVGLTNGNSGLLPYNALLRPKTILK